MEEDITSARFESKKKFTLPVGATIIKNSHTLCVEEIENGFLLRKNYDIQYTDASGETKYEYLCKTFYSKENPVTINVKGAKSLAESLDE